jgi:hypothetical protein
MEKNLCFSPDPDYSGISSLYINCSKLIFRNSECEAKMPTTKGKTVVGLVVTVTLSVAVLAGVGVLLHGHSYYNAPTESATVKGTIVGPDGKTYPHAFISDGIFGDPIDSQAHGKCNTLTVQEGTPAAAACDGGHPTWPSYGPYTHLVLPAHAYVTMTLHVYDSGGSLNVPYYASVVGTIGGTANYDGVDKASIDPTAVQHTFTLHGVPTSSQDPLFVNVPLPQSDDADAAGSPLPKGHTVTFSFITGGKGNYVWNCEYPCGDTSYQGFGAVMGSTGFMSGKVTVI